MISEVNVQKHSNNPKKHRSKKSEALLGKGKKRPHLVSPDLEENESSQFALSESAAVAPHKKKKSKKSSASQDNLCLTDMAREEEVTNEILVGTGDVDLSDSHQTSKSKKKNSHSKQAEFLDRNSDCTEPQNSAKTKVKRKKNKSFASEQFVGNDSNEDACAITSETAKKTKKRSNTIDQGEMKLDELSSVATKSNKKIKKKAQESPSVDHEDNEVAKSREKGTVNSESDSEESSLSDAESREGGELNWDSYPSDTDEETRIARIYKLKKKLAKQQGDIKILSSEDSSDSDEESQDSEMDMGGEASSSEDEDDTKKGLPVKALPSEEITEREKRTVFVGNLPHTVEREQLRKWFSKFGKVEAVRLRSAPIADPDIPRKVAVIKKNFHENRSTIHAYVRFKSVEASNNALLANGAMFQNHVIRVDHSIPSVKHDSSKGVFVGNLPFSLEEDMLYNFFTQCGDIESVRIIRDKNTGVGKGFAYVNFQCSTAVPLALNLDGETLEKRQIRVKPLKYQKKKSKIPANQFQQRDGKKFQKNPQRKKSGPNPMLSKFQGETAKKREKKHHRKSAVEKKREKVAQIFMKKKKETAP